MWRWLETFQMDADRAVADLFSGRVGLAAAFRRDLPEILFHEFPDRPEFTADRERLDAALLGWLDGMRTRYRHEVARLDFDVYGQRLCGALRTIQLLQLRHGIHHIREVQSAWLRWLAPLRLAPERDPALECHRLLSLFQPATTSPATWLQLAQDRREEYLAVALLGLQRLPLANTRQSQVLQVAALLQHYAQAPSTADQNAAEFKRHLAALRGRYPRNPSHWQAVVDEALAADHAQGSHSSPFLARLRAEPQPTRRGGGGVATTSPSKQEKEKLLSAIEDRQQATDSVASRYVDLVERTLQYARSTGDAHYFVHTLCNHGKRLLARPDLPAQPMARIGELIEEALIWAPNNEHTWTFWADWLAYQGRAEHQLWVLREATRLFPDNAPSLVELGRLLMRQGEEHWPEAEAWLREAAQRNPDHGHSRVELARLLMRQGKGHWPEAERWLREAAESDPDDEPSRVVLAQLLASSGRGGEGIALLQSLLERIPYKPVARATLVKLQASQTDFHADESEEADVTSTPATLAGENAVAEAKQISLSGALSSLEAGARVQADFALARVGADAARQRLGEAAAGGDVLAGYYAEWLEASAELAPPPHAWAWQMARSFRSAATADWDALQQRFPENWDLGRYLHWLADPAAEDGRLAAELTERFAGQTDDQDLDPQRRFALSSWRRLQAGADPAQRHETAFALLQAGAVPCLAL